MGNIRIIGPRGSGKTTYLAALAYYPDKGRSGRKNKNLKLQPLNDETKTLADKAEDIILEGESLEPTSVEGGIDALPFYSFGLEIKPFLKKPELINIAVRDYPGEIFEELADATTASSLHQDFINECLESGVDGCLILLNDWDRGTDKFTSRVLSKFTQLMDVNGRANNLRIAVAMSKCERGELWSGRLDPSMDLFQQHLPKTKAVLEQAIPRQNLQFYAISTFGVLGRTDPRPNREDVIDTGGSHSVLRFPAKWKPHGIVEPLYWLSKGKKLGYV
jgi:Double-GTPase 1